MSLYEEELDWIYRFIEVLNSGLSGNDRSAAINPTADNIRIGTDFEPDSLRVVGVVRYDLDYDRWVFDPVAGVAE